MLEVYVGSARERAYPSSCKLKAKNMGIEVM